VVSRTSTTDFEIVKNKVAEAPDKSKVAEALEATNIKNLK
jgi:hypothetical protein